MAVKFIENGILGTLRKCTKDEEKGGTPAGQNSGCETSGEGGMAARQDSGCETSGEDGMAARQNSSPDGMINK